MSGPVVIIDETHLFEPDDMAAVLLRRLGFVAWHRSPWGGWGGFHVYSIDIHRARRKRMRTEYRRRSKRRSRGRR